MTPDQIPPGMYTNADGVTRVWDGKEWLTPAGTGPAELAAVVERPKIPRWVIAVVAFVVVAAICGTGAYIILTDRADRQTAAAAAAAAAADEKALAEQEALEEADRVAREERAVSAEAARKEDEARAQRESRAKDVKELQKHVLKTARKRVTDGYYSEKILRATCMAVSGSSIDDLAETSTTFSCLAVTSENKDGTHSGYEMEAVINWSTGEMSWG